MVDLRKIKRKLGNEKGFTLMELAVVIAIIGILVAVILPRFTEVSNTAKEAKAKVDIRTVMAALELYHSEQGIYPNVTADALEDFPADFQKYLHKWPSNTIYAPANSGAGYGITVTPYTGKTVTIDDL